MSVIREKAELAVAAGFPGQQIDPMTVYLIISVIIELVKLWKECGNTPSMAVAFHKKHGMLATIKLRRAINRMVITHATNPSPTLRSEIEAGLLSVSKKLTVADMAKIFAEQETPPAEMFQGLV